MKLYADLVNGVLRMDYGKQYKISNDVRTLENGRRRAHEVVRSIPGNKPYMPGKFPVGTWRITGVEWQRDLKFDYSTYGPVKIRTDANIDVAVWSLDKDGDYLEPTSKIVNDAGYLLHYSESKTTLGCIRINSAEDAIEIAETLAKELSAKNKCEIIVGADK